MQQGKDIICNCCGKKFEADSSRSGQEFMHIEKEWGYFAKKDGIRQVFDLCEACADRFISSFQILPEERENTEFL